MVSSPLELVAVEASTCPRCELAQTRTQVVFGRGDPNADLLFIGEAPGEEEDLRGLPFVGRSGKLLDRLVFEEMGITASQCYVANVIKCRPPGNRDPRPEEIAACRPWLSRQIELIAPRVVVTLGNFASRFVLDTKVGITKLRGRAYEWRGMTVVPTLHPAAVLRGGGLAMASMRADLVRAKLALPRGRADSRARGQSGPPAKPAGAGSNS
ncbi:uracil-DNA glycosylase [soil metagenome]